jgi:hypothetical protein
MMMQGHDQVAYHGLHLAGAHGLSGPTIMITLAKTGNLDSDLEAFTAVTKKR